MANIIFIDNDVLEQKVFSIMARKFNSADHITYSALPNEVIDYLEQHQREPEQLPDTILLDLYMPGFNGYDFLKKYNELCKQLHKDINVYVISSSIAAKDVRIADTYPFIKQYLLKPLSPVHLKNILTAA